MTEHEVLGEKIWEGTEEEIRAAWNKTPPGERWRFWTVEEFTKHILATPEEVAGLLQRKKDKPGRLE
jgi:hypothetical protein